MSGMNMIKPVAIASAILALAIGGAWAQQPQGMRVNGSVESFDGQVLTLKSDKLGEVKINLTGDLTIFAVTKGALADVKPGAFIGVGAMPQADGSQRAIQVTIFAEVQRGTGEGHRPWDRPNSTMTNGAVDQTVGSVDGQVVVVKYKDGEKKIVIPPDAVLRAVKKPDGTLDANRINVGRGGVVPQ